jgi:hypothetical protein
MPGKKLERTGYRDPQNSSLLVNRYDKVVQDPGDPDPNAKAAERLIAETDRDIESFVRPLEAIHASALHEWGVAEGMTVSRGSTGTSLVVAPGVAIDVDGRHISLTQGGQAEVSASPNANPPTLTTKADVLTAGATLPLGGISNGTYYVMVSFRESWEAQGSVWVHSPWLRLVPQAQAKLDGTDGVPLAQVAINPTAIASAISDQGRKLSAAPVGCVRLRGARGSATKVDDAPAGEVRGRPGGASVDKRGIDIVVPEKGNRIEVKQSNKSGQDGAFGEMTVRSGRVAFQRDDGRTTAYVDTPYGNLVLGVNGTAGDVVVRGKQEQLMVVLDGDDGQVVTGGRGKDGWLRVKNAVRADVVKAGGAAGDVWFKGALRNIANPGGPGIDHNLLSKLFELTGGTSTKLHRHAPNIQIVPLVASSWPTATKEFVFSGPTQVVALTIYSPPRPWTSYQSEGGVSHVDGSWLPSYSGGIGLEPHPFWSGSATKLTFTAYQGEILCVLFAPS